MRLPTLQPARPLAQSVFWIGPHGRDVFRRGGALGRVRHCGSAIARAHSSCALELRGLFRTINRCSTRPCRCTVSAGSGLSRILLRVTQDLGNTTANSPFKKAAFVDSEAGKNRGRQKNQISTGPKIYSQMIGVPVIPSDLSPDLPRFWNTHLTSYMSIDFPSVLPNDRPHNLPTFIQ